jgi:hypothetical protein
VRLTVGGRDEAHPKRWGDAVTAERVAEDGEAREALACALVDQEADRAARGVRTDAEAAGAPRAERGAGSVGQDARLSFA